MRLDGEGDVDGEPWVMENDDAWETINGLIAQARDILGWLPDQPQLWTEESE